MDEHVDHDVFALTSRFDDPGTVVPTGRKLNVVGHRMVQPIRGINARKGTSCKEFTDCFRELRVDEGALQELPDYGVASDGLHPQVVGDGNTWRRAGLLGVRQFVGKLRELRRYVGGGEVQIGVVSAEFV